MLVYQATKAEFMDDVDRDLIADHITAAFERRIHRANPREVDSWRNSMQYMYRVLNTEAIPGGCGVAIEFDAKVEDQSMPTSRARSSERSPAGASGIAPTPSTDPGADS